MSFDEEWNRLVAEAGRRREAQTRLASAKGDAPGGTGLENADLGLVDGPVRSRASGIRTVNAEARAKSKLADAQAAGKSHSGWLVGAASDECVAAWQNRLRALGDLVDDAADALTKAMDQQISQDHSTAARLRASARWLEGA
ncbi:hypothetical protein [Streptomyces megasporus]|uniref:hypothetical protein n=1 Tax=Streptomyces megasporus TaxID=44060 RepID=UPI0004E0F247|nr:hypothetical protein [Streptomyces megasporus]